MMRIHEGSVRKPGLAVLAILWLCVGTAICAPSTNSQRLGLGRLESAIDADDKYGFDQNAASDFPDWTGAWRTWTNIKPALLTFHLTGPPGSWYYPPVD